MSSGARSLDSGAEGDRSDAGRRRSWRHWLTPVLATVVFLCGFAVAQWRTNMMDASLREHLLSQAIALTRTIDFHQVQALSFTAADRDNPSFLRLREQMTVYGRAAGLKSIYSQAVRNGALVFGPESLSEDSPWASPPGTVYKHPTPENLAMFSDRHPFSEGPVVDEYGAFVSAFAPVVDPRSGEVLMAIGIDVDAGEWQARLRACRWTTVAFSFVLSAMILGGGLWLRWRDRMVMAGRPRTRHVAVGLTLGLGLMLTAIATYLGREHEQRVRQTMFRQIAEGQVEIVRDTVTRIRDPLLLAIAQSVEESGAPTREQFYRLAQPWLGNIAIQAVEWVPRVSAQERGRCEEDARRDGYESFRIFEQNARGERMSAVERDWFYPVLHIEPLAGNASARGFDLGSEPIRRIALGETIRTGLPTATDPIALVQETEQQHGLLVYQAVQTKTPQQTTTAAPRSLLGFAIAVVRCGALVRHALSFSTSTSGMVQVDWHQLNLHAKPIRLASFPEPGLESAGTSPRFAPPVRSGLAVVRPLFAFGKSYAITVRPGPGFLSAHPARSAWVIGGVGGMLTVVLASLVGLVSRSHQRLEQAVQERTTELRAREGSLQALVNELDKQGVELRSMSQRLSTLVRNLQGGVLLEDERRQILLVNQAFCQMFGIPAPPEALRGADCVAAAEQSKLLFADPDRFVARVLEILRAQNEVLAEEVALADGRVFERDYVPIILGSAQLGHLWHYRDVTARKQSDAALRRRESILRAIAMVAEHILHGVNWEFSVREVLARLGQATGVSRVYIFENHPASDGELLTSQRFEWTAENVVPQIDNPELQNLPWRAAGFGRWMDELREGGVICGLVRDFPPSERQILEVQSIRALLAVPIRLENHWWGLMGFDECITERKWESPEIDALRTAADLLGQAMAQRRAAAALQLEKQRLAVTIANIADGVIATDHFGHITLLNTSAQQITGYSAPDAVGQQFEHVFRLAPTVRGDEPSLVAATLQTGQTQGAIHLLDDPRLLLAKTGRSCPIVAAATPMRDGPGEIVGAVVVFRDITRELENQRFKKDFVAAVSHELRTPLTSVKGFIDTLLRDQDMPAETRIEFLDLTRRQAHRLSALVEDILELSRIESVPLQMQAVDVAELTAGVVASFQPQLADNQLACVRQFEPGLPQVHADPHGLESVLSNLLSNAIKFTPPGGQVRVTLSAAGAEVELQVQDTGCGMPRDELPRIFNRFYRVAGAAESVPGTGLGLAIVKSIVDRHGGRIEVESTVNQGSCFRIRLPVEPSGILAFH